MMSDAPKSDLQQRQPLRHDRATPRALSHSHRVPDAEGQALLTPDRSDGLRTSPHESAAPGPRVRTRSLSGTWRSVLLSTVAAGAFFFGYGRIGRAQIVPPVAPCNDVVGTTVTCTGDVEAGIDVGDPYTTLEVKELTKDIEPASGTSGIRFDATGPITIDSDTGNFTITTNNSDGIYAKADSGDITVTQTGDISTTGHFGDGIYAYSYGSGDITVTQTGDISTTGNFGDGIYAYSYGSGDITVTQTGDITTNLRDSDGIDIYTTGDGDAFVDQTGDITTHGNSSLGISAASYNGSVTVTQTGDIITHGNASHGIEAESSDSSDPGPGPVTVDHTGNITTYGLSSRGITVGVAGGTLTAVTQTGDITTHGDLSHGIFVYSPYADLTIDHTGDITTHGADSDGIFANDPFEAKDANNFNITLTDSTITSDAAAGVRFVDGADNTLTINKTVTIAGGTADILGDNGNETITNYGTLTTTGDIDLDALRDDLTHVPNTNKFNNYGVFNSGRTIYLGTDADDLFTNAGTLSPGGHGLVRTTALTGDLVQTDTGILALDIDLDASTNDHIDMGSSGTADLTGGVAVNFLNSPPTPGQAFTLLDDASAVTQLDLDMINPVVQATFKETGGDVIMTFEGLNFAPDGLNRNQTALGTHLTDVFDAGGSGLNSVFTSLANMIELPSVANALDQLSPAVYVDTQLAALFASQAFSDNLLSCRVNGEGLALINKEGECWWMNATGRFLSRDRTSEMIGYDETVGTFAAGRQLALGPVWRLSFGMGYQHSTLNTNSNATSDGNQVQGGLALKYDPGALVLAAAVNGGYGWYDTTRPMTFGSVAATAQGKQDMSLFAARLYGSHVVGSPQLFIKPILSGAATRLSLGDLTESGAGSANLRISGETETIYSLSPALEAGTQGWLADHTLVRPFVRAGFTWFSQDDISATATFAGSPSGVSPFSIVTTMDHLWADVAGGLELITAKNTNVRLYYDGRLSDAITIHSVGLKLGMTF